MSGASAHFLGRAAPQRAVGILAEDPLPPLVRDRRFQLGLAAAAAALVLLGAGALLGIGRRKRDEILQAGDRLAGVRREVGALATRTGEQRGRMVFLARTLPERQGLTPDLLASLEGNQSEDVLIQSIAEKPDGAVELQGWSISLQGIQAFKIGLQGGLSDWRVVDSGKPVRQERGWGGLPGYAFEVTLFPAPAAARGGGRP
jgi:hypothetical protein